MPRTGDTTPPTSSSGVIPRLDLLQPGIPPQPFVYPADGCLLSRHCLIPGSGRLDKGPDGLLAIPAPQRYGLTVMFQDLPHHAGHPRTPLKQNSPEAA